MTTVTVSEDIGASADRVWAALSDFGGIKPRGPVTAVDTEGEGVGMTRTLTIGGGRVVERLDRHDPEARVFAYSILNDDSPLPVRGYSASVTITESGAGACRVDWTGTFEPKGVGEAEARQVVEGIYRGGIAAARAATGG